MIDEFRGDVSMHLRSMGEIAVADYVASLSDEDMQSVYDETVAEISYLFSREARVAGLEEANE